MTPPQVKDGGGKLGFTIRRECVDGGAALVVSGVVPDGPACAAGVASGSLLLAVDGVAVTRLGVDPWAVLGVLGRRPLPAAFLKGGKDVLLRIGGPRGVAAGHQARVAAQVAAHAPR